MSISICLTILKYDDILKMTTPIVKTKEVIKLKLFTSEWNVMKLLWEKGTMRASAIAKELNQSIGWNRNTTYTIINKCIGKKAIERIEPHFQCKAMVSREEIIREDAADILEERFDDSLPLFVSSFASGRKLSKKEIDELRSILDQLEEQ